MRSRLLKSPVFYSTAFAFWLFYLWLSRNTPYGIDDWQWGVSIGLEQLKKASLNGRYFGNLCEVIVSRSVLLKTLIIGSLETMIPLFSVLLVRRFCELEKIDSGDDKSQACQLLLANTIFLTLPRAVWQQTYGWVAGFSNYGLAAFMLLVCQGLLLDNRIPRKHYSKGYLVICLLIGLGTQLVLENITIFVFSVGTVIFFSHLLRFRRINPSYLAFYSGVVAGTIVMFSGNVYSSLLVTGHTNGVGRHLSFSLNIKALELIPFLYYRFLYYLPGNLWGNNWLACTVTALCMISVVDDNRPKTKMLILVINCCFVFYFVLIRFIGPLENYILRWNEVLGQRVHFLFFLTIAAELFFVMKKNKRIRNALFLLWTTGLLVMFPMLAVNTIGERSYLPAIVFLGEFCVLVFCMQWQNRVFTCWKAAQIGMLTIVLIASVLKLGMIYRTIGKEEKQREQLIAAAVEKQEKRLYIPDYSYGEYHWITEPVKGGGQIRFFREFYGIPDEMELQFDLVD